MLLQMSFVVTTKLIKENKLNGIESSCFRVIFNIFLPNLIKMILTKYFDQVFNKKLS